MNICKGCGSPNPVTVISGAFFGKPDSPVCAACHRTTMTAAVRQMGGDVSRLSPDEWDDYVDLKAQKATGLALLGGAQQRLQLYHNRLFDPVLFWAAASEVVADVKAGQQGPLDGDAA